MDNSGWNRRLGADHPEQAVAVESGAVSAGGEHLAGPRRRRPRGPGQRLATPTPLRHSPTHPTQSNRQGRLLLQLPVEDTRLVGPNMSGRSSSNEALCISQSAVMVPPSLHYLRFMQGQTFKSYVAI